PVWVHNLGDSDVVVWDFFINEEHPADALLHAGLEPILRQLDVGIGAVSDEAFTRLQHTKFPYIGDAAIVVQFENLRSAESSFRNTRKRFEFESGRPWLEWRHPAHKR